MDANSDDEWDDTPEWRGIPGTVIVINAFDAAINGTASVAHEATCRMVRQCLRAANSHNVAVCFYGIEDSNSSILATKNVQDIMPLNIPTLDDFKKLRNCDPSKYKPAQEFQLSDVLWHCSKIFANFKKLLSTRTVLMMTRLDIPPVLVDQKPTLKRVVDLVDSNIDIKVINIAKEEYTVDPFYVNFMIEANKGKDYPIPKPIWDIKEIETVMHQQTHRHLAVAQLNFDMGNKLEIGVGVYNLVHRAGKSYQKKMNLERETNAPVTTVTKTMKVSANTASDSVSSMDVDEETETKEVPLLRSEILHYQEYGGERQEFTDKEKKMLQNPFGPPMLKLLGFKPASFLCKEKWFLKGGAFLYPNENIIEGSTVAFKAFHQACVETGVVAICVLCTRVNAKPNIVALSPCSRPLGMDIEIGFDIIPIPFAESIRDLPDVEDKENSQEITEQQKALLKDILTGLKFDYTADMFENPKLQSEYRAVEAKALQEKDLDPFVDTTKAKAEIFENLPGGRFEDLFGPFQPVAPKRPASSSNGGSAGKRIKSDEFDESILQERLKYGTVHQYTVKELKNILQWKQHSGVKGIPALTGMKKDDLVDLVKSYYSE